MFNLKDGFKWIDAVMLILIAINAVVIIFGHHGWPIIFNIVAITAILVMWYKAKHF